MRCVRSINPITGRRCWRARKARPSPIGRLPNAWCTSGPIILRCPPTRARCIGLAGTLENEAIRPHVNGRFVDLLTAVEQHPAMIAFLDNQYSAGENSDGARNSRSARPVMRRLAERGQPQRQLGINENLAREILELHTLGVNGGYTQADVTSFAQDHHRLVDRRRQGPACRRRAAASSTFATTLHEPGRQDFPRQDLSRIGRAAGRGGARRSRAPSGDRALHRHQARAAFHRG